MENSAQNSDPEWKEEEEKEELETEEAPSLADLPLAYDREFFRPQEKRSSWKQVLKSCRNPRTSDSHDFEFNSSNSTPKSQKNRFSDELCPADKLFYKGQLLPLACPLRDFSFPARQDSQSSNSSNSTSQSSSDSAPEYSVPAIQRISGQKVSSSWQYYFGRGLLSSPDISWSSTTLRSQYSNSSSPSSPCGKARVRVLQEDCINPKGCRNPNGGKDFLPSVKRREESRKGWRIFTSMFSYGGRCKDASGVVAGAHKIGRFNCKT